MKILSRLLAAAVMVMFVAGSLVTPAKADEQPLMLTPTEDYVKGEILADHAVDLATRSDRTIHGAVLAAWWRDSAFKDIQFFKIKNAIIEGTIDAEGVSLPYAVGFVRCTFKGDINLESAKTKTFRIDNDADLDDPAFPDKINAPSIINGFLRMSRMIANGDVALYGSEFNGPVTLFDAQISGNLFAKNSKFHGTKWLDKKSKYPFELWKAHITQSTEFTNAVFNGIVSADYAVFGADVKFDGATFEKTARFKNIQSNDIVDFRGAKFMDAVTFESSVVKRDLQFTDAQFAGETDFNYLSVGRFLNFSKTPLNGEEFDGTNVTFHGAKFLGNVKFEGVQVGNVLDFTDANFADLFKMNLATVGGRAVFQDFTSPKGLDLSHDHFADLQIIEQPGREFTSIKLDSTAINGDLYVQDVVVDNLSAQDLMIKDSTTFMQLKVRKNLNLSNASLGSFIMSSDKFWPEPKKTRNETSYNLNLRGATYANIGFATLKANELNYQEFDSNKTKLLGDMVGASIYSPQAYRTLEHFLIEKGQSGSADDVEFDRRHRELEDGILPNRSTGWFLSWFLLIFSGYGQHPEYALGWGILIVILGALIFWYKGGNETSSGQEASKLFIYCLLYSFALFFPFALFEFARKWEPKSDQTLFVLYKQIHKLLGLVITPTAVLAFSGLIK